MWAWIIAQSWGKYVELCLTYWREILIVVLAVALFGTAKLDDFRDARVEKRHAKEIAQLRGHIADANRLAAECKDNLNISQTNQLGLEIALSRTNYEVEQLRLEQVRKQREAEERVAAERASRRQVEDWAAHLNARVAAETSCVEKVRITLEEVLQ